MCACLCACARMYARARLVSVQTSSCLELSGASCLEAVWTLSVCLDGVCVEDAGVEAFQPEVAHPCLVVHQALQFPVVRMWSFLPLLPSSPCSFLSLEFKRNHGVRPGVLIQSTRRFESQGCALLPSSMRISSFRNEAISATSALDFPRVLVSGQSTLSFGHGGWKRI